MVGEQRMRGRFSAGDKACPQCGSVYEITYTKIIMRDKDSIACEVCGAELVRWNGAVIYFAELRDRVEWPPESN